MADKLVWISTLPIIKIKVIAFKKNVIQEMDVVTVTIKGWLELFKEN